MKEYLILFLICAVPKFWAASDHSNRFCDKYCQRILNPMMNHMRADLTRCDERNPQDEPVKLRTDRNKKYLIEQKTRRNWYGAAQECHRQKGHLMNPQSEEDYEQVVRHLMKGKHYWIDITDLNNKDKYYSLTTGFVASYLNWHEGEPNNYTGNERCLEYRFVYSKLHAMNDRNCSALNYFICEV